VRLREPEQVLARMRRASAAVRIADMPRFGMRPIPATWLAMALIVAVASVPISAGREEWFEGRAAAVLAG
jgi:hypothetical protein